ncbi:NADPH:adrenodoxin oxidoreductase-like 3 [Homarus americanus]|uniref:NADPH:adrenodoxin oxidoreductase, mitochondrial n=1 Tax=Homarus americanus TaxID=6706 RepID=A0A8J5N516_HOMAM|nr:NADPH:adrenodoxin oxidoreductase-like 3 [Homarus americanus]
MMLSCGVSRLIVRHLRTGVASTAQVPQVCIVGSGPAGFYTAQQILKSHAAAQVDMYEKLPVPFGLVRYGVAPDHPEVKNCINTFTQTAAKDRFTFLGNVDIGSDITFSQLREAYHAVVLAYGAAQDRALNIPGESLPNVLSAREFVGWYNGLPENADLKVDLNVESVGIIGQGNVAVDVARILLTPVDILKKTDIPENILERLNGSRVRHMTLVGRRGPEHVAFTIKELREMVNLEGSRPDLRREDYKHLRNLIPNLPRPRKRLLELLAKTGLDAPDPKLASSWAAAEKQLEGEGLNQRAVQTDETESLQCGLILRSIGYKGVEIDSSLPFDQRTGTISNNGGRVTGQNGKVLCTGPVGVILSTMTSGFTTGKVVVADMETGSVDISRPRSGQTLIKSALAEKGVQPVSFDQWNRLNQYEVETGAKLGKPREKVSNIKHMMDIIHQ